MNLQKLLLTNNACYQSGRRIKPAGIMVHSTGANNPNLNRYVGPGDKLLGRSPSSHWNQFHPGGREVCVHAFIGKLPDGSVATYQTLPWDMRGWHAGGKGNDSYIGFEICEDGLTDADYFARVYREAVELCATLCEEYGIKPESPPLICHSEGYRLGVASNHGDVMHWFPKHGKSMDTFRADVAKEIKRASERGNETPEAAGSGAAELVGAMEKAGVQFDRDVWTAVLSGKQSAPEGSVPVLMARAANVRDDFTAAELRKILGIILKI